MDDLLREFLTETSESLSQIDVELVRLEQNPEDPALLGSIFRLMHTIKGTCGFLGLPRLEHVAHAAENILGKFRDGELKIGPEAVTLILRSVDVIKLLLAHLEETQTEPEDDNHDLIAALDDMAAGKVAEGVLVSAPQENSIALTDVLAAIENDLLKDAASPPVEVASTPAESPHTPSKAVKIVGESAAKESAIASQSIRVDVGLLESLMNTVSELVLTRNQLLQILRTQKDTAFTTPLQRLNQVTSELQEGVMKTRMQPIGNAWSKLPRIIRDLSVELGKKIDLIMLGEETELDRQVLELIKDPLTHMVRNSADHGIEVPADRLAAGKNETGTIALNAFHQGGHIIIEITDDGKGLPLDKIRAKALQNGIATADELASMPDQQVMQFIFKAGFSTAAKVTSVSGRGVGMDVVRTNIERIGGTIELRSKEGKGSSFHIKIPLTLAIVSALIVECKGERFAVPQLNVVELVHASADSEHKIEKINDISVLRLRDRLLPLISLETTLKLGEPDNQTDSLAPIIIVQVGGAIFGIIVDRVFDTEEIVVKPVSPILHNIPVFSGNTILGDGTVVMILDPNGLAVQAVDTNTLTDRAASHQAITQKTRQGGMQSYLLFKAGDETPKAVSLSLVARLEDIPSQSIEYSSGVPIVQYRGALMPLISLANAETIKQKGTQPIIVFADDNRNIGILADEIIDIVQEHVSISGVGARPGCFGSAVISGKATDMIDVAFYLATAIESWFNGRDSKAFEAPVEQKILLVDDSPFFRNLLTPILSVAGYTVTAVENPVQAMKLYEAGGQFDAIVSDIEMPEMNGFEFVASLRNNEGRWSKLPIFALSSHATERDIERGRQMGFTDYIGKYNREGLLSVLHSALNKGMVTA